MCIYYNNSKQNFGKVEKKTLQTNIAVNDLYDTKLCGSNSLVAYESFLTSLVWSIFHLTKFLLLSLVFACICTSQGSVEMQT